MIFRSGTTTIQLLKSESQQIILLAIDPHNSHKYRTNTNIKKGYRNPVSVPLMRVSVDIHVNLVQADLHLF